MTRIAERLGSVTSGSATAEVWHAWVDEGAEAPDASEMSAGERTRLSRFRDRVAAARYARTRALVRRVLGERLGVAPRDVPITQTDLGKPIVAGDLHFNVSHSGDLIVLAVSAERAVGIDIERVRDVPRTGALIARWLTDEERGDVSRRVREGSTESDAFLRVWSLKEARLKALGVGIAGAPSARLGRTVALPLDGLLAMLNSEPAASAHRYIGAVAFA